jgi:hypothetical protein
MTNKRKLVIAFSLIAIIASVTLFAWNKAKISLAQNTSADPMMEAFEQQTTKGIVGVIRQGEVDTQNVEIGEADEIVLFCIGIGGPLKLALIDPGGKIIDSSTSVGSNSIKYYREEAVDDEMFKGAYFNGFTISKNSFPGIWKMIIAPASAVKDSIGYILNTRLDNPTIRLISSSDKDFYKNGDPVVITAKLSHNFEPIFGAKVKAIVVRMPDSSRDNLVLHDDGLDGDLKPSDGFYTGIYKNTNISGYYSIYIQAESSPDRKFSRQSTLMVSVANTKSSLIGVIKDYGQDMDGDTLFDSLRFDIDLDISPSQRYTIEGSLYDKNGSLLANGRIDMVLPEGRDTVSLAFDGEAISKNRVEGPYIIRQLILDEMSDSGSMSLGVLDVAGQSKPYSFREFQGPPILIMGKHSDYGIDTDGDGLFDSLIVEIEAELRYADNYFWSIYLWDLDSKEIDLCMGRGYLDSGNVTFSVTFNGDSIAKSGIDGPYEVTGLGMYGEKGANTIYAPAMHTNSYRFGQFGK